MPSLNSPRSKALSAASPSKANSAITLTKPISAAPAASPPQPTGFGLRLELQQEQLVELTREADTLRAELDEVRQRHAQADAVREHERGELVASYERMLSEQAAAVRQYESRCACVGSLRLEARKRDAELSAVRTESAAVRQRLTVVSKVWRQSVLELESCLEREIRERHQLEAERAKSNEMQRKRLQSLQREADARAAEAKKMAEREEIAVHQAVQQATKQAERAFESKAKEIKREANDSLRKERSSHQVQLARAVDEAERERERLVEDAIANLAEVRREADEALRHRMAMHAHQLLGLQREQSAAERCVGAELTALEVELEAAHAATAQAQAAAKAAADAASQTIASLKGVEKDLRAQLKGVREAHSALEKEHAKLQQTAYQEKTALCEAHTASLAAAKKEADEARKQLADELKGLKETLERMEGEVTKACQLRFEAERAKVREGHKKELARLQASCDTALADERMQMRTKLEKIRKETEKKEKEIAKLRELRENATGGGGGGGAGGSGGVGGKQQSHASPPPTLREPTGSKGNLSPTKSPAPKASSKEIASSKSAGHSHPAAHARSVSAPRGNMRDSRDSRDHSPERMRREALARDLTGGGRGGEGGGATGEGSERRVNLVMDMAMAPVIPLPAAWETPGAARASPRAPLRPEGDELTISNPGARISAGAREELTPKRPPLEPNPAHTDEREDQDEGEDEDEGAAAAAEGSATTAALRRQVVTLEASLEARQLELAARVRELNTKAHELSDAQHQITTQQKAMAEKEAALAQASAKASQQLANAAIAAAAAAPAPAPSKSPAGPARSKSPARAHSEDSSSSSSSKGGKSEGKSHRASAASAAASYSEERAEAAREAKQEAARLATIHAEFEQREGSMRASLQVAEAEKLALTTAHACTVQRLEGELRALTTALDASAEEVRQMEQAMVAAVVAQRLRLDVEIQKEVERIAVADALRSALEAEEKVKSLRAEVRAAEAALGAARAAASHEKAAAELAASALTTAQKEADERLERALHEAATQAKSALLTEKSKAQAESRKAIARAEREAEERLLAQRDDFGKQEKGLREKIVELQKDLTAARQRAAKVEGSAQGGAHGGAPSTEPSHRQPSPGRGGGDSSARGAVPGSARSVDAEPSARGGAVAKRHGSPARGQAGAQNGVIGDESRAAIKAAEAAAAEAQRLAAASAEQLRVEREEAASLAAGALTLHNATLAVLLREMISLEGESAEEAAAADRLRERLAMETKHLQRKLSRVTKESEQKMADERAALESRLQETERRSEARLRAERTRLAVRYGNQGKQVVQEKLTEKLESLGYNGDGGASPALSSRRSLSPGR